MFTDKEIDNILDNIVIIIDTREKKNKHILSYFDHNNIKYKSETLYSGDYSFYLPNYSHLGIDRSVLIEKKNSLDEISTNLTSKRTQFADEFSRTKGEHLHLVIENATFKKINNGSWRSKMTPQAMWAGLLTFSIRYNLKVWFTGVDESPKVLYNIIRYEIYEKLRRMN